MEAAACFLLDWGLIFFCLVVCRGCWCCPVVIVIFLSLLSSVEGYAFMMMMWLMIRMFVRVDWFLDSRSGFRISMGGRANLTNNKRRRRSLPCCFLAWSFVNKRGRRRRPLDWLWVRQSKPLPVPCTDSSSWMDIEQGRSKQEAPLRLNLLTTSKRPIAHKKKKKKNGRYYFNCFLH